MEWLGRILAYFHLALFISFFFLFFLILFIVQKLFLFIVQNMHKQFYSKKLYYY